MTIATSGQNPIEPVQPLDIRARLDRSQILAMAKSPKSHERFGVSAGQKFDGFDAISANAGCQLGSATASSWRCGKVAQQTLQEVLFGEAELGRKIVLFIKTAIEHAHQLPVGLDHALPL